MPKINLNKLEIIRKIREHFITQGALAWDSEYGTCRYRTSDGRKCAVGALIPDELYDKDFENRSVSALNACFGEPLFDPEHLPLLAYIQRMHDSVASYVKDNQQAFGLFIRQLDSFSRYLQAEASNA